LNRAAVVSLPLPVAKELVRIVADGSSVNLQNEISSLEDELSDLEDDMADLKATNRMLVDENNRMKRLLDQQTVIQWRESH
jgi:regulator of replication initiation timing